jgi:hypothetical protein
MIELRIALMIVLIGLILLTVFFLRGPTCGQAQDA